MLKRRCDFLLRSQIADAKLTRDIAKSKRVREFEAKQRLMPLKNDTHTCLIHERESPVDRGSSPSIALVKDLIVVE
jgi:hypothetical protein